MKKQIIRLDEGMLVDIIKETINETLENEELEEGFFDTLKGAGKALAKDVKSNLSGIQGKLKNKYSQYKQAGEEESQRAEDQRALNKCAKLYGKHKNLFIKANHVKKQIMDIAKQHHFDWRAVAQEANQRYY